MRVSRRLGEWMIVVGGAVTFVSFVTAMILGAMKIKLPHDTDFLVLLFMVTGCFTGIFGGEVLEHPSWWREGIPKKDLKITGWIFIGGALVYLLTVVWISPELPEKKLTSLITVVFLSLVLLGLGVILLRLAQRAQ